MTIRLPRSERRALQREDTAFLRRPLDIGPDSRSMAANLRHLVRLLQDPLAKSPCSDAVAHLTGLFDRTAPTTHALACRRGCAHCCSQPVLLSGAEAFFIARQIRHDPQAAAAVVAHARTMDGVPQDQRIAQRVFCPLLRDAACSIYAARPLACHAFVSVDVGACIAAFERFEDPQIPMPQDYVSLLYACRMALTAALRIVGLDDNAYELNAAVAAALADERAERRWLKREPVLSHLPTGGPIPASFEAAISRMVSHIGPTV